MKKSTFRTEMNSKAMKLVKTIVANEDLSVEVSIEENAIGDTMIVARGNASDIIVLRDVFNMVNN